MLEGREGAARSRNKELDEQIGVTSGELGAPNLKHPPARIGAFSAAASGAAGARHTLAEGPMPPPGGKDD